MKLNEKQKVVAVGVLFAGVIGGLGFLNYTKFKDRSQILSRIDRSVEEEQVATAKIKQIPELREKKAKLINIIDQYVEILPKEEHIQHDVFIEIIDGYRKDSKIIIQKTEYLKPKQDSKAPKQENFVRHRYKFKLLGTIPDFIEFVNKIENHTRFLKVDEIDIRPLGSQPEASEDLDSQGDQEELARASEKLKEIDLVVSTYTYFKGTERKA